MTDTDDAGRARLPGSADGGSGPSTDATFDVHAADPNAHGHDDISTPASHREVATADPIIPAAQERWRPAPGYTEAMHGLCVECHKREVQRHPDEVPSTLAECRTCHDPDRRSQLRLLEPSRTDPLPKRVAAGAASGGEEGP